MNRDLTLQTRQLLKAIREENADAPRVARNDARAFHRWCACLQSTRQREILAQIEAENPWITQPDEPYRKVVPL